MDDNHEHHRNSDEFIGSSYLMTAFTTQTSLQPPPNHANVAVWQELVALSVFIAKCPFNKESRFQWFGRDNGSYVAVLASHRTCHHKRIPRASWTCRSYTVLENGKHTEHKLIVAWTEWIFYYYLLITQHISCACSCLFSRRNNNQPFVNERLKLRKECFKWGDNRVRKELSWWQIDLGRAGMHGTQVGLTRQTSGRKGCWKKCQRKIRVKKNWLPWKEDEWTGNQKCNTISGQCNNKTTWQSTNGIVTNKFFQIP